MRSSKWLTTGVLIAAVMSLSACTGSGAFPSASTSSTASPSASASAQRHSAGDRGRVAAAYETFLNGMYSLDATQQTEISRLYQQYSKRTDFTKLTAAQQANVVTTVRGIDPALDVLDMGGLDAEQKFLIYAQLLALGAAGSPTGGEAAPSIQVAESKVQIKGDTASVPLSGITFSTDGSTPAPYPSTAPIVAQRMPFKKTSGRWLIDAKSLAAEAASPGASPSPSVSGN